MTRALSSVMPGPASRSRGRNAPRRTIRRRSTWFSWGLARSHDPQASSHGAPDPAADLSHRWPCGKRSGRESSPGSGLPSGMRSRPSRRAPVCSPSPVPAKKGGRAVPREFKRGDRVSWNSEAGRVSGIIRKKISAPIEFKGYTVRASKVEPQYLIESDTTDHLAMHKGSALRKIRGSARTRAASRRRRSRRGTDS